VKVGAIYPQTELGGDPKALDAIGRAAETLGYDSLVLFDHVAGAEHAGRDPPIWGPYTERDPFHDPFVAFAYLAAVTQRISFLSGILVLPQRQTLLVARQAADVELLSGGRLQLGVGVGWNYVEFEALGEDFHTRGARMEEQIVLLRRFWEEPLVSARDRFHTVDRVALNPRPAGRIPILCGGLSEPAFRRAARLADGFVFSGDFDKCLGAWAQTQRYLREAGRDPGGFEAVYLTPPAADIPATLDLVRRWGDAGGHHVAIRTLALGFTQAEQHIDRLAEIRRRLG
jgi:probable F420-dependent oxidoreductase